VPEGNATPLPATSSVPPDFPGKQRRLFQEVLAVMNEHRVPYAVSGAFALHQHTGIWRYTKDLDLFLTKQEVPSALELLQQKGYVSEICDPVWLAKARRDDFYVDLITGMSNGVISVDPFWIQRAQSAIVVGVETRVMAAEELIASKLFVTRRERFDGADIAHVIYGTKGKIDWDRVLTLVGEHWEILLWALIFFRYAYPAHSDYVPFKLWEDLLTHYMNLVSKNDPKAKFRGSLLDENMFAIDVKEWGLDNVLADYRAQHAAKPTQVEPRQPLSPEQPKIA
jgi:Nucleotidyl transferase of unknown function (DUF2204)